MSTPIERRPNRLLVGVSGLIVIALVVTFAILAFGPGGCPDDPVTLEATATATELTPSEIRACRGQQVTLRIAPEFDGELHLHGVEAEIEVQRGEPAELRFVAEPAGQFPIESHPSGGEERQIGVLIVDEP